MQDLNPKSILASLKRPLQFGLAAAVIAAGLSLLQSNRYTSEARILPAAKRAGNTAGLAAAAAAFGVNVGSADNAAPYVEILKSRWVGERLLTETYTYSQKNGYFGRPYTRQSTLLTIFGGKNLDQGLKRLESGMVIQKDLKTGIITLRVQSRSPELSQAIARRAIALLNQFLQTQNQTQGGAKAAFATQRLQDTQASALNAEQVFREFLTVNRNYPATPDPAVRLKGARLEAELQLWKQLMASIALSREQALMEQKDDTPIVTILDAANLPAEKSGPARSAIVIRTFLLVGLGTALWQKRDWIRQRLVVAANELPPPPSPEAPRA